MPRKQAAILSAGEHRSVFAAGVVSYVTAPSGRGGVVRMIGVEESSSLAYSLPPFSALQEDFP